MDAWRAPGTKVMGLTLSVPKMRQRAMCAASLAVVGFVAGALISHPRRAQDTSPGNTRFVEQSEQAREGTLPLQFAVERPVDAPAVQRPSPDALAVDALPSTSYDTLRRAIELF